MKNLFVRVLAVVALAIAATVQTMAQQSFAYQAVIRNSKGELVANQEVSLKFSLINGGETRYSETQKARANQYGNISVMIGEGEKTYGDFAKVPWNTLDVTLKVEVDVNGGTDYISLGETKLNPVPYAMYASSVSKAVGVGSAAKGAETLFEVDDREGRPVFAVTNDGIVIYVDDQDDSKLRRSGFLIVGRDATKDGSEKEYFSVTTDGTQIFVDPESSDKLRRSGFLITGRDATKEGSTDKYLSVDGSGTKVYVDADDSDKLRRSGFLITGRDATKAGGQEMFAVDGNQTTVYVDEQDGGKLRRSGFLITGRDATKAGEKQYVIVNSERTDFQTEAFTVTNIAPQGSPTAAEPVSVLVVSNKHVAMKTDMALEGEVRKASYDDFENEGCSFALEMACGTQYQFLFDDLLRTAKVDVDFDSRIDDEMSEKDSLMFVFEDGLLVGADAESEAGYLYFDKNFQLTSSYENAALSIREYLDGPEEGTILEFEVFSDDIALDKFPAQFVLGYYNSQEEYDNEELHRVLFTVNLTVSKMICAYGIEAATLKYNYAHKGGNEEIDYCFYNKGWDNYAGFYNSSGDEIHGKYNHILRVNWLCPNNIYIDSRSDAWSWNSADGSWFFGGNGRNVEDMKWPLFSFAGINTNVIFEHFGEEVGSLLSGAGIYNYDNSMNDPIGVENITIGNNDFTVEKHTFNAYDENDNEVTCTIYVYKGLILKITKQGINETTPTTILECTEFKTEAETSFHRWLKKSGVTNYQGIAYRFGDLPREDETGCYFVDLNLPSGNLWAANNVGAPTPYDRGDYLQYARLTEPSNGIYQQSGQTPELVSGGDDNNDAAWKWGENDKTQTSNWCMPSRADWQELIDNCFWVWIEGEPGVHVYEPRIFDEKGTKAHFTSQEWDKYEFENENQLPYGTHRSKGLFLPLSGSYNSQQIINSMHGYYWARDYSDGNAAALMFDNNENSSPFRQVGSAPCFQGLQVRAVAHKNTKYWVRASADANNANGSLSRPFQTIGQAIAYMDKSDNRMTYTLMVDGRIDPAVIGNCESVKQITICGANPVQNGVPQDAIVGNISERPLTVNSGNIVIKNLKLTGGGIDEQNSSAVSQVGEGGGLYLKGASYNQKTTVTLDTNAFVMLNAACSTNAASQGGGVFVGEYSEFVMRGNAKICNNKVGGTNFYGQGGGMYIGGGGVFMYGGEISENTGVGQSVYEDEITNSQGGGVYIGEGSIDMFGGRITSNTIEGQTGIGAGVYKETGGEIWMYGGEISGNTSTLYKGLFTTSSGNHDNLSLGGDAYIDEIECAEREVSAQIQIVFPLKTNRPILLSVDVTDYDGSELRLVYYSWKTAAYGHQVLEDAVNRLGLNSDNYTAEYNEEWHSEDNGFWYCTVDLKKTNK